MARNQQCLVKAIVEEPLKLVFEVPSTGASTKTQACPPVQFAKEVLFLRAKASAVVETC